MIEQLYIRISSELGLNAAFVKSTLQLLESGATVPFIARYRKELTGSMDEVQIALIRDRYKQLVELEKRREAIIASVKDQEKLTDELLKAFLRAETMAQLEDLYLPYRPKRKTRAVMAIEKGLEPLAAWLIKQLPGDVEKEAKRFINQEKDVLDEAAALAGARDIIAEWINEDSRVRERLRRLFDREAVLSSRLIKGKDEEGIKYQNWFEWEENARKAPSHRVLAIFRGESEGFLKMSIEPSAMNAVEIIEKLYVRTGNAASMQVSMAAFDSYKRLLQPSLETEMRQVMKEKADEEAIRVFSENLRQLLMAAPLHGRNVLALDPGFRTGCKIVCLDAHGNLLHNETIYPHPPQNEVKQSAHKLKSLVNAYKIDAIAVGNGTAGRETEAFIRHIPFDRKIIAVMVNESGASVYSASSVAREEFPDYDVTVRGSVSIGRRLIDPLAELVKIDPKSIGVGQYQHDVNQKALQQSLDDVVLSCVNKVGVDVNTASKELLTNVSGIGPVLAKNIVEYRNLNGPFTSRQQLKKVPRLGDKAFEQAAGFLRIANAENPLDGSAVHPESYHVVADMVKKYKTSVSELMSSEDLRKLIIPHDFVSEKIGLPTVNDILQELAKPGRDPRLTFEKFEFDAGIHSINDVIPGMVVPGLVTNITNFGAFVDIGVHQDGLVHISHLADRFIRDPNEVVKLNQKVMVRVLEVDADRKRISLSMREIEK